LYLLLRTMPGPPVVVCQGDEVIVEVHNHLDMESTSIHFHGR
jgi:FtsP/CotA-like multicopper oxidase with cupredoxin domain